MAQPMKLQEEAERLFLGWFCVVFFEVKSALKKRLNFDGLSIQETIGQHFPMNCSKIGHTCEAFTYLFG